MDSPGTILIGQPRPDVPLKETRHGFTLIEIVIVLAISAVLSAIAIPRAAIFIDRIEVRGATTEAESMFSLARHYAISRGTQTTLDIAPATGTLTVKASGQIVETREIGAAHGVTISTNKTSITYSPIGVGYGAANFTMVMSKRLAADTIYISRLGRVRH